MGRKKSNARKIKDSKKIKVRPDVRYIINTKKRKYKNDIRPGIVVASGERVVR